MIDPFLAWAYFFGLVFVLLTWGSPLKIRLHRYLTELRERWRAEADTS